MENARSIADAVAASDKPGRSGVTTPMAPENRRTGTIGDDRRQVQGLNKCFFGLVCGVVTAFESFIVMPAS